MDRFRRIAEQEKTQPQSRSDPQAAVELSVVVPISERRDDLRELYLAFSKQLSLGEIKYEFIFVFDGTNHEVLQTLKALKEEHSEITVVTLNRRFGEATALSVGFARARGAKILTVASYFQVEPREIHRFFERLEKDESDLVISWRYPRIDSVFNQWQSRVFHWLIRVLTGVNYHDISCGLRLMKREVAQEIQLYGDLHRFLPLLAYERGFKVTEIQVKQSRHDAKRRVFRPGVYLRRLLDILTLFFLFKFTKKPLRFFGLVGSALSVVGAAILGYLGLYRLLGFGAIAGRPLMILGVLLMVLGVQLFSIGLLGEIIIFTHARRVKEYSIDKILQ